MVYGFDPDVPFDHSWIGLLACRQWGGASDDLQNPVLAVRDALDPHCPRTICRPLVTNVEQGDPFGLRVSQLAVELIELGRSALLQGQVPGIPAGLGAAGKSLAER